MSKNPVTVAIGQVAEGMDGKVEADLTITYHDNRPCTVACIADDELTALSLRSLVRQRLELGTMSSVYDRIAQLEDECQCVSALVKEQDAKLSELERENADLRRQCHDHDRRREASMGLARGLAEHASDCLPHCPECRGMEHLACVCEHDAPGSMDPGCSTIGIDSHG